MKICAAMLLALGVLATAEDNPERDSLRGITAFKLLVEPVSEPRAAGFTADELKTFSELRLRKNGLRMSSSELGVPYLYLNIQPYCIDSRAGKICAATVMARFNQMATVRGDPATPVSTWHKAGTILVSIGLLGETVTELLGKILDAFSNDFLAANQ